MEKDIKLNRLPAATWNWLSMNETKLQVPDHYQSVKVDAKNLSDGITWRKEKLTERLQTGMGDGIYSLLAEEMLCTVDTLHISADTKTEEPIVFEYHYEKGKDYWNCLQIYGEENCHAKIILFFHSDGTDTSYITHQTLVHVKENADIQIYTVQMLNENAIFLQDFGARQNKYSHIRLLQLQLGASKIYAGALSELLGNDSSFIADTGYQAKDSMHIDMNYVARHIGKKTKSNMSAMGILQDNASKLFRGTIDFITGCSGSKGQESEEVLLLGEHVSNQTIPLILCGEEDVEGSHGATIGKLDEQMLFYLQTRGFEKEQAEQMIARSKIDALCQLIPSEIIQNHINEYLK